MSPLSEESSPFDDSQLIDEEAGESVETDIKTQKNKRKGRRGKKKTAKALSSGGTHGMSTTRGVDVDPSTFHPLGRPPMGAYAPAPPTTTQGPGVSGGSRPASSDGSDDDLDPTNILGRWKDMEQQVRALIPAELQSIQASDSVNDTHPGLNVDLESQLQMDISKLQARSPANTFEDSEWNGVSLADRATIWSDSQVSLMRKRCPERVDLIMMSAVATTTEASKIQGNSEDFVSKVRAEFFKRCEEGGVSTVP